MFTEREKSCASAHVQRDDTGKREFVYLPRGM